MPYYYDGEWWYCDQYAGRPGYEPPVQIQVRPTGTTSVLTIRGETYQEALAKLAANPQLQTVAQKIVGQYEANKPRELFPGATALAGVLASAGVGLAGAPAWASATLSQLAEQVERSQNNMSINLSGILGAAGSVLGGINSSGYGNFTQYLGGAAQIAAGAFAPQPVMSSMVPYQYNPPVPQPTVQAIPTAASAGAVFSAAGGAIARVTGPILLKIAGKLGLKRVPSLTWAMSTIRKMAKLLTSPEAVAVALGITTAELAALITANSSKRHRRMNPANSKALRRAARRIKSFHRLCTHTDVLRGKGRRTRGVACGSCRKSPCRC